MPQKKWVPVSHFIPGRLDSVLVPVQSRGRERTGGERILGAESHGSAVQRSATEPHDFWCFSPPSGRGERWVG